MPRPSFRAALLLGFLLVAGTLTTVAMIGWLGVESIARTIQAENQAALSLSAAAARVAERGVDLERAARQFLVLREAALAQRFEDALQDANAALDTLERGDPAFAAIAQSWRTSAETIRSALASVAVSGAETPASQAPASPAAEPLGAPAGAGPLPPPELDRALDADFARLATLAQTLDGRLRTQLAQRNEALLGALDTERARVITWIVIALALAAALAALSAWWLLRPLSRIEQAISVLGENQLGQPIRIDGPADLRQLGERLDWLRLRLAELEANRNRVLRHVSHELKTPLASLHEGIALLSEGVLGELEPRQREVVTILAHSAKSLQGRIEQLLEYNASQFDARRLELADVALVPLLREVVAEHRLLADSRELAIHISGDAPIVRADAGKLRIAFANLVANAIAFSPTGGRIELLAGNDGERVLVDVLDEGPGIAPDELERVFEPFYQGRHNEAAATPGNGIGLAIVREFITAHRGRVRALPSAYGAHFRIELPHA